MDDSIQPATEPDAPEPDAHVLFELDAEDGWPPVSGERLWATSRGGDRYTIENVPWFVRDLAVGDLVLAVAPDSESHPVFQALLEPSDHVTVRVIVLDEGPLAGDVALAAAELERDGVWAEVADQFKMLALDIAPEAPLAELASVLISGEADGRWVYEEGRVTDAWIEATG